MHLFDCLVATIDLLEAPAAGKAQAAEGEEGEAAAEKDLCRTLFEELPEEAVRSVLEATGILRHGDLGVVLGALVLVEDDEADRRTRRAPLEYAREDLHLVGLASLHLEPPNLVH